MKVSHCGVGNISYTAEGNYVGDVLFQFVADDRLTGMDRIRSHDLTITVRAKGSPEWSFERAQEAVLAVARETLDLSVDHLRGASIASLKEYNRQADSEENQSAEIAASLAQV